jgi:hypothetical protein
MKNPCIIIAAMLFATNLHAEEPKYKPEELATAPSVSLSTGVDRTPKKLGDYVGKVVRLRFTCVRENRGDKLVIEHVKDAHADMLELIVPAEAAKWVASLPTNSKRERDEFVYARVISAGKAEALGTKIVNGAKGKELAW